MNGIVFAECRTYGCEQFGIFIIGIDVAAELCHRILHFQDSRDFAGFGIYNSDAIRFLDSEIDVMEDTATLPAGAEGPYGNSHTEAYRQTDYDDV